MFSHHIYTTNYNFIKNARVHAHTHTHTHSLKDICIKKFLSQ